MYQGGEIERFPSVDLAEHEPQRMYGYIGGSLSTSRGNLARVRAFEKENDCTLVVTVDGWQLEEVEEVEEEEAEEEG